MQTKEICVPGIGNISITRRKGCKRLCIKVNKEKDIRVSIPFRLPFNEGEKFIFDKIDWIREAIQKVESTQKPPEIIDENTVFSTRSRKFELYYADVKKFLLKLTDSKIQIFCPNGTDIQKRNVQELLKSMVYEAMRYEAREYLPGRVKYLASLHGLKYQNVKVKNAVSRWGSCSYQNNINLNINLVRLPDVLSDYIILHELAHTVHKNHGPKFWDLLEKLSGNSKEKALELKKVKLDEIL